MIPTTWAPNPLAIAALMVEAAGSLGSRVPSGSTLTSSDWESARELLEAAFKTKLELIFDYADGQPPLLQLFQDLATAVASPQPMAKILALPLVQEAVRLYTPNVVEYVLPYVVPVADAIFGSSATVATHPTVTTASHYQAIDKFTADGTSYLDPVQGATSDCYLIAAMIALAWTFPNPWNDAVAACQVGTAAGDRFRFAFHGRGSTRFPSFKALPDIPVGGNNLPRYAHSSDAQEAWPAILEKAYAMQVSKCAPNDPTPADYQSIGDRRREPQAACRMLVGGSSGKKANEVLGGVAPSHTVRTRCDTARLVTTKPTMAWTLETTALMGHLGWSRTGLIANHAYAVLGIMQKGDTDYVVLRNPHGKSPPRPEGYASGVWKPGAGDHGAPEVTLDEQGVFAIKTAWFDKCFDTVAWVTLSA